MKDQDRDAGKAAENNFEAKQVGGSFAADGLGTLGGQRLKSQFVYQLQRETDRHTEKAKRFSDVSHQLSPEVEAGIKAFIELVDLDVIDLIDILQRQSERRSRVPSKLKL